MSVRIVALGTATPSRLITQDDALEHAKVCCRGSDRQLKALTRLYRRSTISNRSTVVNTGLSSRTGNNFAQTPSDLKVEQFYPPPLSASDFGPSTEQRMRQYEREAIGLATDAAINTIAQMSLADQSTICDTITNLVTVSCTGFGAPGFDVELIGRLGLSRSTQRHHLGFMGCHGALNGLRVASALAKQHPREHVLLCAAELCSIHFQYGWNADSVVANSLFADGAAAVILSAADSGVLDSNSTDSVAPDRSASDSKTSYESEATWRLSASATYLLPDSLDAMSWKISDHGFVMTLSATVPHLISNHLSSWFDRWLASLGMQRSDIQAWAIHPGGPRILDACGESLELSADQLRFSRDILSEHGNMSSPTVIFILERIRHEIGTVPTVMLAFGPGLTIEAALLT